MVRLLLGPLLGLGLVRDGTGGGSPSRPSAWNLSAICSRRHDFTATTWVHTCGFPGDELGAADPSQLICRNFTNLAPSIIISDVAFGDHANVTVPQTLHGTAPHPCGTEGNPAPSGACPAGLAALPPGLRSVRFDSVDSHFILNSDADNILPGWNASNHSWAPDAACQPDIVGQMKGPWPGLWLDHAARQFGRQSALFFPALKAAGGTLDEIVLDTEIGFYTTWGIADNMDPTAPGVEACVLARWTGERSGHSQPESLP